MSAIIRKPESNNEIRLAMETQSAQKYLQELHTENIQYLSELALAKDEIKTYINRLSEVVSANTGKEVLAEVEHFQNQIIVQRNNLEELSHGIYEHIHHVVEDSRVHAGRVAQPLVEEHGQKKDEFQSLMHVIKGLRSEFNHFIAKWI